MVMEVVVNEETSGDSEVLDVLMKIFVVIIVEVLLSVTSNIEKPVKVGHSLTLSCNANKVEIKPMRN